MKGGIIYKATNLINGKAYVGKTIETLSYRKEKHISDAYTKRFNMIFHRAILKHGERNFKWETLDRVMFPDLLLDLEKFYIAKHNCKMPHGYNMTDGGEGLCGHKHSILTRDKMSRSAKNKPPMKESTKEKIRLANIGKHHSEITKKQMSISRMGHLTSEKTREKLSIAHIKYQKNKKLIENNLGKEAK